MFTESYVRKWREQHPERVKEYERKWQRQNRVKANAKAKVHRAIANGSLKRQPCQVCGNPKSEAHHEDYSKPLEVLWFCHKHHFQHHRKPTTTTMTTEATTPVKEYLRKIGSKGGKKSAQHPNRPQLNRDAANARWRGHIPKPKELPK